MIRRIFLAALALSAGIASPALAQPAMADPDDPCDATVLAQELSRNEAWYEIIRIKRRHGYLPPPAQRAEIERRVSFDLKPLTLALARFGGAAEASALVYGSPLDKRDAMAPACVWLVGPGGIRASGTVRFRPEEVTRTVWSELAVTARSRAARSPRPAGGACPPAPPAPSAPAEQSPALLAQTERALAEVADQVIPPAVAAALGANAAPDARLFILPRGNLRKLPFAALPVGGRPLIESHVPIIVPSLTVLKGGGDSPRGGAALVVGDPDLSSDPQDCWTPLPAAEAEARHVAATVAGAEVLLGEAATHEAVTGRLAAGRPLDLVYLATHGLSDPVNPADGSFLALAGGKLNGAQLRSLELEGDPLVVLSACQTGLGKEFDEGVFGLPEAWHFAGADRIVMSLWNVDDAGTERLMRGFVDRLAAQGWRDADLALAGAMRAMRKDNRDPMIWAAFSYYGRP